jgi:hypothetical protein
MQMFGEYHCVNIKNSTQDLLWSNPPLILLQSIAFLKIYKNKFKKCQKNKNANKNEKKKQMIIINYVSKLI